MPVPTRSYDVLLEFNNDTRDSVSIQLLRDYGLFLSAPSVPLNPMETIELVLESGSLYQYAVHGQHKVVIVM
jgi:hypothetical protein